MFADPHEKLKQIAGRSAKISLNEGSDNLINDALTTLPDYSKKKAFRREVRQIYGEKVSDSKLSAIEYDHPRGSVDHENLQLFNDRKKSYEHGVVIALPKQLHYFVGHARREQHHFDSAPFSKLTAETRLSIANNSTMMEVSLQNEIVVLDAAKNASAELLEEFGITRKDLISKVCY